MSGLQIDRGLARGWMAHPEVGRIHPNDDVLYPTDPKAQAYAFFGRTAVEIVRRALADAGRTFDGVESCLDLASGYGRVLRYLAGEMAPERITACDVVPEAVAFCSYEHGARPVLSDPEFEHIEFEPRSYDLIWIGSLVTHLDERLLWKLLRLLPSLLAPDGVLVLTTLGGFLLQGVERFESRLGAMEEEIQGAVRDRGFAFVPYDDRTEGLGYTWLSRQYVCDAVQTAFDGAARQLFYEPQGWGGYQDVLAVQGVEPSAVSAG